MRSKMLRIGAAAAILLTACGGTDDPAPRSADRLSGHVLVSAAASLGDAFAELAAAFEAQHPEVDVVLNTGGSSALREQILEGAPADVFASANESNMERVVDAGEVATDPTIFATNQLQIAVPAGNPGSVAGLADLARPELLVGLCAEAVPCGELARRALDLAGITPEVDTDEPNVRALLTKIEAGELDAGITYVSDVASSGGTVDGVALPPDVAVFAEYPIAVLAGSANPDAASAFVTFVLSADAAVVLRDFGFGAP